MQVISYRAVREFWQSYPESREILLTWWKMMERGELADFGALRRTFQSAEYCAPHIVFSIAGGRYWLIVVSHFSRRRMYIRHVFTYAQYSLWCEQTQRKTGGRP